MGKIGLKTQPNIFNDKYLKIFDDKYLKIFDDKYLKIKTLNLFPKFPWNICNGCCYPKEYAYSSEHLVLSHLRLACVLILLEIVIFPDFEFRTSLDFSFNTEMGFVRLSVSQTYALLRRGIRIRTVAILNKPWVYIIHKNIGTLSLYPLRVLRDLTKNESNHTKLYFGISS